jgi:hypothetical protein
MFGTRRKCGDEVEALLVPAGGAWLREEQDKSGEAFYGRGASSRLPFIPVLQESTPGPGVHGDIAFDRRPRRWFAGDEVERFTFPLSDEE